jgi:hypothetical protein
LLNLLFEIFPPFIMKLPAYTVLLFWKVQHKSDFVHIGTEY